MTTNLPAFEGPVCPVPLTQRDQIVLGHGSGGRMTAELIQNVFKPVFTNPALDLGNDFAAVPIPLFGKDCGSLITSVDAHIVKPIFFPGGDIGKLAICGTVNDVAVSGAKPLYITAGFILEEGLPIETLKQILDSMKESANEAGVLMIAGDTKVVEKGGADKIFITTTGFGWLDISVNIGGGKACPGDIVIISGNVGDHGIAVLSARGDLGFDASIQSDTAPLNHMISALLEAAPKVHVLRDPTRGGLATTLNEIAHQSHVSIRLEEEKIPVNPITQSACEMLGFDPLYVANEGKVIVIVPPDEAQSALKSVRSSRYGSNAAIIGKVEESNSPQVLLSTPIGGTRLLDVMAGELLPRIC